MIRISSIAFLLGIIAFLQLAAVPSLWNLSFLPLALSAFFILLGLRIPYSYQCIGLSFCAVVCGFLWTLFHAAIILNNNLSTSLEGDTVLVKGYVVTLPEEFENNVRFKFQTEQIMSKTGLDLENPGKLRLRWYRNDIRLQPGDYWQLHVRLKRPYGFSNPGSFDYEGWLFQQRIRATGYVTDSDANKLLNRGYNGPPIFAIDRLRHLLRSLINQTNISDFEKGFLLALSLGDRSKISASEKTILRETGTSHLLAISGLHIGLVSGLFFILGRWLWAFSVYLPRYLACQRFAMLSGLLGALTYAALAGFSIPTQRALIMLFIWMLSLFLNRKFAHSDVVAMSLIAVLIIDPFAAMDIGFWLSFIAISIIAYGMACRIQINTSIWLQLWLQWGKAQYVVAIGLLPVLILWLQQYPLFGILANIIAVPYIGLFVLPLILLGVMLLFFAFPLAEFILALAGLALSCLWSFLEHLSSIDISVWYLPAPSSMVFMLALIGVLMILAPRGIIVPWLGVIWLLPFLWPYKSLPEQGDFWLTQLDVGQGLATVVQTHNHALVYDAGDKFSAQFNAGQAVIIPFLEQQHISHPDILLLSHGDRDHIGGAKSILERYPYIHVLTNATDKIHHPYLDHCIAGMRWHWDGVDFEILSPESYQQKMYQENNSSCVLKISNVMQSALLPGDIEQIVESRLVRTIPDKLSATVLIAPHHGSKTSSSIDFIDAVAPQFVIFAVGYRNRFGFPKEDIISRYQSRQVKMLNTARDGALTLMFINEHLEISHHRQQNLRFWNTQY